MCGRYANHVKSMGRWEQVLSDWPADVATGFNVTPSQIVPVFTASEGIGMRWGLIPHWAKDTSGKYATFNARSETLTAKPAFRSAWKKSQRCLVPALGYYEWRTESGHKQPYFVRAIEDEPIVFGGLWDCWQSEHEELLSCTIITQPARGELAELHGRMPMMLEPEQAVIWLQGSENEATNFLAQSNPEHFTFYAVAPAVNNPRNQGPDLIEAQT